MVSNFLYRNIFKKVLLILLLTIFQFNSIFAQSEIPDSIVRERLHCIQNMLNKGRPNANLWWYGWLVGYSAATVGQGIVYFVSNDKSLRQDMALGAATTFLGAAGQLITPMVSGYAPGRFDLLPENTSEERLIKLVYAEDLLKSCADREIEGRSWQTHTICSVVNLSSGLITWLGFKRSVWAGLGNFALNTAITEAQIWSQPTRSINNYNEYNRKYKFAPISYYYKHKMKCYVNAYPGGVILKLSF